MLILTRRPGERLILKTSDCPIEVVLNRIDGQQTKVSIDAPQSVRVMREELLDDSTAI